MIVRNEVGYANPKKPLVPIGIVDTIFIHHSVTKATGSPKNDAKQIQSIHFGRGYSDIAYTLLAHPSGVELEGRVLGGKATVGAHTSGHNSSAIAVCAIGNYENEPVSQMLLDSINRCVQYAKDKGWVVSNPKIRSHSEVFATACAGKNLKAKLNLIGGKMSADAITKEEFDYLHILAYGGLPGPNYDGRWTGRPLTEVLHAVWGADPLAEKSRTLASMLKAKAIITPDQCPKAPVGGCDVDAIAEAVAEKLAERLKE